MDSPSFKKAQTLRDNGRILEAIDLYKKARKEALKKKNFVLASESKHMIGVAYYQSNDYKNSRANLLIALKEFEKHKNHEFAGFTLRDLALNEKAQKNYDSAQKYFIKSLAKLQNNLGHRAITKSKLALMYSEINKQKEAVQLIEEAISELKNTQEQFFLSTAYFDYAKILKAKGEIKLAMKNAKESLRILNLFSDSNRFTERRKNIDEFVKLQK